MSGNRARDALGKGGMKLDVLWALAAVAVVSSVGLFGCNKKAEQCDKFIGVINDNGKAIKASSSKMTGAGDDAKTYDEVAKVLDTAADNMTKVELKDDKLKEYATEYETMLRNGAKAARDVVKAQGDNDLAALTKAMGDIGQVETTEAGLVAKVNGYCTAK